MNMKSLKDQYNQLNESKLDITPEIEKSFKWAEGRIIETKSNGDNRLLVMSDIQSLNQSSYEKMIKNFSGKINIIFGGDKGIVFEYWSN